ncbi:MAG: Metallopeptidase, partial [Labilithrix sp.]|nr:Metallopeptidase [Labilithrix sp.]
PPAPPAPASSGRAGDASAPASPSPSFTADMSPSIAPGDDFYAFANGAWMARTEIPRDRSSWGVFEEVAERTHHQAAEIIVHAGEDRSPEGQKVATYYGAFMDEASVEALGLRPLEEPRRAIAALRDKKELARALGESLRADVDVLNATDMHTSNVLGLWVAEDLDDPKQVVPFLLQGGLGMPDRSYYLDPSPRMKEMRAQYAAHIVTVLTLAGEGPDAARAKAARIVDLETKIAGTHVSREDADDVEKGNNRWARAAFAQKAPGLDWNAFFAGARLDQARQLIVWHPPAVIGLARLVQSQPLETWKDYLAFRLVEHWGSFLTKAFVKAEFDFYGKTLEGIEEPQERWKIGVQLTNDALGEAVGKLYVAKHFPASEKARAQAMVKNIVAAFGRRIDQLTWMAPSTKARAKAKLASLEVSVGYPDHFRDYSALEVRPGDALGNARRAEIFEYERNLAKLGKPVDRGEWVMVPQLVNAVNLPVRNALQFPAAILQPPFFDRNRPAAFDYGATGATIGHELSHSFDDTGALFDDTGKKSNWWTKEDLAHFKATGAALAAQYDGYKPFPDLAVNGKQTLGENIADVAGLAAAYDAYRLSLGTQPAESAGGFTGNQQFFIAFAQSWRHKTRPEELRSQLVTDGHAPGQYRAHTVRNLDPWYAAFDPRPGQALFLPAAERVRVW